MSSTSVTHRIRAPRAAVYGALIEAQAVSQWMVPDGMSSEIHSFEGREGGAFRISLTYDAPTDTGKTSAQTDTFHGRFQQLVPGERVVQVVEFETEDRSMQGEMTITYVLTDTADGTEVTATHDGLPLGVSPTDNETGFRMSLAKLAALLEP